MNYLSFNDARNYVRKLNLKNQKDWCSWVKYNKVGIPSNPNVIYKNEWVSLSDWIGSGVESFNNREYHEYEYCKLLIKDMNFKNRSEFYFFVKNNNVDKKIPNRPDHVYKKKNKWEDWQSFLSIEKIPPRKKSKIIISYKKAKKFVSKFKFTHQSEYLNYIEDNNIEFLPKRPDYVYREKWTGYLDFLGCEINRKSFGEKKIKEFLDSNKINYIKEKKFEGCKNIKELPFDFYLPDYKICIEYDGELHYRSSEMFGGEKSLNRIKKHDAIKDNWCINNEIKLIRISYKQKSKIEKILNSFLI
jgi:very-short-patch-repair endonuclease